VKPYPFALLVKVAKFVDASAGPDACHPWRGTTSMRTCLQPLCAIGKQNYNPRRVVRELALDTRLPSDQRVRDTCGNSICCNPRHLKGGSLADRLEAQVDKSGGPEACWPWTGYTFKRYGRLRTKRGTPWVFAHRLAYMLAYGVELSPETLVMHTCDNPPCCNPVHLRPGTDAENVADCIAKKRNSRGENHRKAARNAKAVREAGYVKVRRPPGRPKRRVA
jgi:hypothetical protein